MYRHLIIFRPPQRLKHPEWFPTYLYFLAAKSDPLDDVRGQMDTLDVVTTKILDDKIDKLKASMIAEVQSIKAMLGMKRKQRKKLVTVE